MPINLLNDYVFSAHLKFGSGVPGLDGIGAGFVYVMTKTPVSNSLIGAYYQFMGYGSYSGSSGISNSFGIEFDTWLNKEWDTTPEDHIAYLSNGSMGHILTAPILYNYANVETGDPYCVTIVWKRTNGIDSTAGYDLEAYVKSGFRASKHFNTLAELISDLKQSNPYVTWGITSATGSMVNAHQIEFISLENGNNIVMEQKKIAISLYQDIHSDSPSRELMFTGTMIVGSCGESAIDMLHGDTIRNTECLKLDDGYSHIIEISGIDNMSNA